MEKVEDMRNFSLERIEIFLNSFHTIMSDCDGVLWHLDRPIDGAFDALKTLQLLGKRVLFVSNNSTLLPEDYLVKLKKMGFEATIDQIIIPSLVILWYLKNIDFQGKALVIGTKAFKKILEDGGINIITPPTTVVENLDALELLMQLEKDVKAVIIDFDINLSWVKLSKALLYLEQKDVLFVCGALDRYLPISSKHSLLGIGQFVDILVEKTGRTPIGCAKPSKMLQNYLLKHYKLDNPDKCLFIGDSLASDMKFADSCGFSKLWVGSGIDTLESCLDRKTTIISSYYLPNLGSINQLIEKLPVNNEQCQREKN